MSSRCFQLVKTRRGGKPPEDVLSGPEERLQLREEGLADHSSLSERLPLPERAGDCYRSWEFGRVSAISYVANQVFKHLPWQQQLEGYCIIHYNTVYICI